LRVTVENVHTGERQSIDAGVMIVLIGAAPHTDWLTGAVALDDDGFVLRGAALNAAAGEREPWTRLARAPFPLEVIDEVYPVTVSSDDHAVENQKEQTNRIDRYRTRDGWLRVGAAPDRRRRKAMALWTSPFVAVIGQSTDTKPSLVGSKNTSRITFWTSSTSAV